MWSPETGVLSLFFLQGNRCTEWDQRNVFPTGLRCRKLSWTSKNRYFKVFIVKVDQSGVSAPLRNLAQEFKNREPEENREHRFVLPVEPNFGNVLLFNHTKEKRRWRRKGEQGTPCWGKQLRFGKGFVPKTPILWFKLTFKVVNQLAAMNTKLNTLTQVEHWIKKRF